MELGFMNWKKALLLSFILVALCYLNSLPNDFVFDDGPTVASNPAIRTVSPLRFLASPYWTQQQYEGMHYRPFTIFSLSVDYAIWKRWAPGFHITNLALHAINGFLLFLLCTSLVGEGIVPIVAMLIYLAHPLHNEAVTGIVGRSDLFAAGFMLSAWLLFRRGSTLWPAVLFFLALLSKENAIVLPGILVLDLWWSSSVGALYERPTAVIDRRYSLMIILAAALPYLALRFWVLGGLVIPASAQYMGGRLTSVERLMTSGRVFLEYLRLIFFPVNVAGDYDFNAIPIANALNWDAWLGLLLIAGIVIGALLYRRRNWVVSFGVLFAFLAFLPASNWITPISVLLGERFLYLPLAGLSIAAAVVFGRFEAWRPLRLIAVGGLMTAIVLCNSHDYIRRNDFTFFGNMVRVEPNSAKARLGYGYALFQAGRLDEAAEQLEAGLRIIPEYPELLTTLALTRIQGNDCSKAWPLFNRALQNKPDHADTHRRMGDCYFREGKIQEAESMYRQAVESIPFPDSMLYFMWGKSLEALGQTQSAIAAYERAALIDPENVFVTQTLSRLR
jgi:tetratricopeptide (TPR) repeat protein